MTGIFGALLGVGLGAGALAVLASHVDQIFRKDLQPYNVRPSDLVPIIVLGVVTATIAALLPARTTSRIPVLAALSGADRSGRSRSGCPSPARVSPRAVSACSVSQSWAETTATTTAATRTGRCGR